MTGPQRVTCLVGLGAALVLSTSGCGDPYTYFNVHVTLQQSGSNLVDNATQRQIYSCLVYVLADGKQIENGTELRTLPGPVACKAPDTPLDVGTMDYSTKRSSGTLEFIINMKDTDGLVIVQGSTEGGVRSGQIVSLDLVAETCPKTCSNITTCTTACKIDTSSLEQ
jgi:hypothetical protein